MNNKIMYPGDFSNNYMPRRLPISLRRKPPTSLASRNAAGPYSLASDELKEMELKQRRGSN